MAKQSYRELDVWEKSMRLVEHVYTISDLLPQGERYGLTSQLRRAAVSIPANIAEGYGRAHRGDYLHHLSVARGSLCEVETLLILTVRLKMLKREQAAEAWKLSQDIGRMLLRLHRSLQRAGNGPKPETRHPIPEL